MIERGGKLDPEEKQLAKRYAVFFRIPRLSSSSPGYLPPEFQHQNRNTSDASENPSFTGHLVMQPQPVQAQEEYAASLNMPDQTNCQTPMFDPQSFPPLQPIIYDGSNHVEFGFSEFFGGYQDTDLMLA